MGNSLFKTQMSLLSNNQWRVLRLAAWAAVLAQVMVIQQNQIPTLKIYDFLLLACYVVIAAIHMHAARKQEKVNAENTKDCVALTSAQRNGFRAVVAVSLGLFAYGAFLDPALLVSSGMVSVAFLAVFLWTITVGPKPLGNFAKS